MHVFPWMIIDGCETHAEALEKAAQEAEDLVADGEYDYGGPVALEHPGSTEETVMSAGTDMYRTLLGQALELEERIADECWSVLNRYMSAFKVGDPRPNPDHTVRIRYVPVQQVFSSDEEGRTIERDIPFTDMLCQASRLYRLLGDEVTYERRVYDRREDIDSLLLEETRTDVRAVLCDFHF